MFSTLKVRIIIGIYVFLILSIPVGAYLASQQQTIQGEAKEEKKSKIVPTSSPQSGAKKIQALAEKKVLSESPKPSSGSDDVTIATSFGPTLSLKAKLEGRPTSNQSTSLFIGISEGILSSNPKFLLSFTVDLPASGEYSNLSIAGLTPGSTYTALLKGSSQIATSSAFTMSPSVSKLASDESILLLTGDLNDDNLINSADYSLAKASYGTTTKSSKWNANIDFNIDGIINSLDLAYIVKNFGK